MWIFHGVQVSVWTLNEIYFSSMLTFRSLEVGTWPILEKKGLQCFMSYMDVLQQKLRKIHVAHPTST